MNLNVCLRCGNGTFSAEPNSLACSTHAVCEPGQYVAFSEADGVIGFVGLRRLNLDYKRNAKKCKTQQLVANLDTMS